VAYSLALEDRYPVRTQLGTYKEHRKNMEHVRIVIEPAIAQSTR